MLSSGGKHSPSCCQMLPVMNVWGNHNSLRTSLTPPYPPAPSVRSISKRKARVCCNGCLPSFAPFTSAPASVWQQFNSLPCVVSLVPSGGISKGKSRILLMHAGTVRVQFCIMPLLLFSPLTPALHYLTGSFLKKKKSCTWQWVKAVRQARNGLTLKLSLIGWNTADVIHVSFGFVNWLIQWA